MIGNQYVPSNSSIQAQKFSTITADDDDLEEEGLLETPLDKVEPYGLFKSSLMSTYTPLPLETFLSFGRTASTNTTSLQQNCSKSNPSSTKT